MTASLTPTQIETFFQSLHNQNPHPKGELDFVNTYTLLVAVVLSAQSTDVGVNKATKKLFQTVDTPEKMVALGLESLKNFIKTIGLYNTKAKNILALSKLLIERHQGQVPSSRDPLQALPGVGRKTANVVLNMAFGQSTIAVDTHVFRISNRTGLAPGPTPRHVEDLLEARIPKAYRLHAHHWLILHGRYICKARKPLCEKCCVIDSCLYDKKETNAL